MDPVETYKFEDGSQLEVIQDQDPMNPRTEYDNLGTMACFHKRYGLGDEGHGIDHAEFGGWDEMEQWIEKENPDCVILPLFLFDHSGITIRTTSEQFRACDSAGWDWGQVGFIFITREKINEEYGNHGGRTDEQIETYLRGEVETYDQYLRGNIYGFVHRLPPCPACEGPGEEGDSCWGFFGSDPLENGMSDHLDDKYKKELQTS